MRDVEESRRLDVLRMLLEVRSSSGRAADCLEDDRLLSALYSNLRRLVRLVMASQRRHSPLQPAAIVQEAFASLLHSRRSACLDWQSRAHFLSLAARQMRLVLDDHTGPRLAVALDYGTVNVHEYSKVQQALRSGLQTNTSAVRFLEMDCFGGMTDREIALIEHISTAQACQSRLSARTWLASAMLAGKS